MQIYYLYTASLFLLIPFRVCRVAFKSPATIAQEQATAKYDGESGTLAARGRHDPCVVARAVPIVEAMAALVIMEYAPYCPLSCAV